MVNGRKIFCGVLLSLLLASGFGWKSAPYYRVDAGPVVRVGPAHGGGWSVTTVQVQDTDWFQWMRAELTGERLVRIPAGAASAASSGNDSAQRQAMDGAQIAAVLVAAQIAAGRAPLSTAGLQVTSAGAGFQAGDVLLAVGDGLAQTPLREASDLQAPAVRSGSDLHLLVVPKRADGSWGAAESRRTSGVPLSGLAVSPNVAAVAYPLGAVEGPSAGLILALARLDALTAGNLTGGRRIAGTGAIGVDGTVNDISEVAVKAKAAAASGASVFFVPQLERAEAVQAARGTRMSVVGVGSVSEAVRWLCRTGGRGPVC
jgi:PDZ domain-containing secreted protein